MTKLKPILFATPMITAILEGRKTQTRRVLKQQPTNFIDDENRDVNPVPCVRKGDNLFEAVPQTIFNEDILWVRESWQYSDDLDEPYLYKEQCKEEYLPEYFSRMKWKPSIHMPKEACRIFLKVTNVRVERLNEIREGDALAEGVAIRENEIGIDVYNDYLKPESYWMCPENSFRSLWQSINGPESWEENPYVWVYEFERVEQPEVWP